MYSLRTVFNFSLSILSHSRRRFLSSHVMSVVIAAPTAESQKIYSTFPNCAAMTAMTVHIRFSASGKTSDFSL